MLHQILKDDGTIQVVHIKPVPAVNQNKLLAPSYQAVLYSLEQLKKEVPEQLHQHLEVLDTFIKTR
jgi:hypothetical protein